MCEFLSFKIETGKEGMKVVFAPSFNSHSDIPGKGAEAEWTQDADNGQSLEIRIAPGVSEHMQRMMKEWVLKNWPTRKKLWEYAFQTFDWSKEDLLLEGLDDFDFTLPDNLTVGGALNVSGTKIETLPKGLKVGLSLMACNTMLKALPDDIVIGKSLDLYHTHIEKLPDGMDHIKGYLDLNGTKIKMLPDGLIVDRWMDVQDTMNITSLPKNLHVGEYLDLYGSAIESLPEGLEVGLWLDIRHTRITSLPKDLKVGELLQLDDQIKEAA